MVKTTKQKDLPEPIKTFSLIGNQETSSGNTLARVIQMIQVVRAFSKEAGLCEQHADQLIRAAHKLETQIVQHCVHADPVHDSGPIVGRFITFAGDESSNEYMICHFFTKMIVRTINKFGHDHPDAQGYYDVNACLYAPMAYEIGTYLKGIKAENATDSIQYNTYEELAAWDKRCLEIAIQTGGRGGATTPIREKRTTMPHYVKVME